MVFGASYNAPSAQTSMIELYLELDDIVWYYKLLAAVANWTMLAGFVVFPSAFDNDDSKYRVRSSMLRIAAVGLLVFGYILTGALCWRFKNLLFQLESIFLPGFTSSTIGFMSSLFNVYGKIYRPDEEQWSASAVLAVVLSCVFMVLYGATSLHANRKLDQIRKMDEYRRQVELSQGDLSLLPEEERTRRNLLNLLLSPSSGNHQGGYKSNHATFQSSYSPVPTTHLSRAHNQIHSIPGSPTPSHTRNGSSSTLAPYTVSMGQYNCPPVRAGSSASTFYGHSTRAGSVADSQRSPGGDYTLLGTPHASSTAYLSPVMTTSVAGTAAGSSWPPSPGEGGEGGGGEARQAGQAAGPAAGPGENAPIPVTTPRRQNSIFASLSATVGHGRERIGAGFTSWTS